MSILGWILGRRLANQEQSQRKIGVFEGVPAMGLDGMGSSAYGPEAALTILIPLGAAGLSYIGPIMGAIVGLLAVLYFSYRQTIAAYPSNGGAYIVSRENLGRNASLLAASALMVDYVLNVAVGISAGVGALVSALPSLHAYTLWLCLGILLLVTVVNLRGTLDAGRLFALPTYLFVASFLAILAIGVWKAALAGGQPSPVIPPPPLPQPTESVGLLLLMHAFASGCTAMTGVEAVSNGMIAFKDPAVKHGRRTLAAICLILGLLLGGIAFLSARYRLGAMDQEKDGYQSVLSQLAHAVVGDGIFYYVAIGSLLCVLALSANTSFVDFPRLCRIVAEDGYLPKPFAMVGRRLVFSVGILYLSFTTGLLLVVFGGITDHLIPLFAIGAFLTFTLSQTGMVLHWVRALRTEMGPKRAGHRMHLAINALGGAITALALVVIVIAKFREGAWITVIVIPLVIVLLRLVRRYYDHLEAGLREPGKLNLGNTQPPVVLVVTQQWNSMTDKALSFAFQLSKDVIAVHVARLSGEESDEERAIRGRWSKDVEAPARAAGLRPPRLVLLNADYRLMYEPLLKETRVLRDEFGGRTIAVLLPEVVPPNWWQYILHTHRARRLHAKLLEFGGSDIVIISMPWYIEEPRIEATH
ncbi:APC family permease [Mesorhizobium sp. WSM3859]|uniref:APC family permease n=1 Tax=Mesorhizobium sp. WSM3859 TaxID=2029402 RepID=UPI000BB0B0E1|nr:APC family permease [Mesorhizobium sp. WSM3859]PBC06938.1 amino acid transporter [Mesorhizobium sp. WSM3859]